MRPVFDFLARSTVFANIVLLLIAAVGLIGAYNLKREVFPNFSLDMIVVRVIWPGADPAEVEEGISRKVEEAIESIEGIRQYSSTSAEGYSNCIIEVAKGYDPEKVLDQIRNKVEAINTFPLDAERPIVEELVLRSEVLNLALYGDGMSEKLLKEWGETLRDELQALPSVSQVQLFGARDYEIGIELSEERLREYGLTFEQVAGIVAASNLNLSGGTMRTEGEEIRLRTVGRKYTGEELAKIVLAAGPNGEMITLDRVADIRDEFTQDRIISRFNGKPSINISVLKTEEEDALAIGKEVKEYIATRSQQFPEGIKIAVWNDLTRILEARLALLYRNGLSGLILVLVLLWLFLDIRLSFWVGLGIPVSIAGALAVMYLIGASINMISLFGFIMVLGILVDDGIVVGEAIYVARMRGAPPIRAAVDGVMEVGMPIFASVTTTIVAFAPLFFIDGIMGKFMAIMPVVVIACLFFSLIECLVLFPAHLNHLPGPIQEHAPPRNIFIAIARKIHHFFNGSLEYFAEHIYSRAIVPLIEYRYATVAFSIAICVATAGYIAGGFIKFQTFPKIDSDVMTATIEFPEGTPIAVTEDAILRMEQALQRLAERSQTASGEPLLIHAFSLTGQTIEDNQPRKGNHLGSVRAELLPTEFRGISSEQLMVDWEREIGPIPGVEAMKFAGIQAGPPGAPIEIWVQGGDNVSTEVIREAADELKEKLASYEGVYQIQHDFRPGKREVQFELKPEARTLGITVADLARQVYAGYFGEEAVRIQRGRDDVRVRVRYPEDTRNRLSELEQVRIRTTQGAEVPLMSVARVQYVPGFSDIKRTDGMRRAAVTAEVNPEKANPAEIFQDLNAGFFNELMRKHPGIRISQQGEIKKMNESFGPLSLTFPLALIAIYVIIATSFRSYLQPIIVMVAIPFGLMGAVIGHVVLGFDLSMMSVFGMVALAGVVVNDAIVLIECVNELLAEGMTLSEALRKAGARRLRPIFLTSVTTVGGLSPLIMEKDLQAQFLVPMAISLAAGVTAATFLTLVILPCLMAMMNDARRWVRWLRTGVWPTPEEVEPARWRRFDPDSLETDERAALSPATSS